MAFHTTFKEDESSLKSIFKNDHYYLQKALKPGRGGTVQ